MDRCISYQPYSFEYLIPSPIIISTLCLSFDRTELFIISVVRLFIWIILYFLISEYINLENYPIVKYLFITMFGINILYIGMVVAKDPIFSLGAEETVSYHNTRTGSASGAIPYTLT